MHNKYDMVIYIPTFNCIQEIDKTIESVLNQTFDHKRIKVVVVDNHSTDGTYEKILELAIMHKENMSVFRLSQPTTPIRMWRKAAELLTYTQNIGYSTVLTPGSILNPSCIEKVTLLFDTMRNFDGSIILCETNIIDKYNNIILQNPIYEENCILKSKTHDSQFFTTGIGHTVQAFFRGFFINTIIPLDYANCYENYTSWFNKGFYHLGDCMYLKEKLAIVKEETSINFIDELITLFTMLKELYYEIEVKNYISSTTNDIKWQVVKDSYRGLALLALKYAITELQNNEMKFAKKCLLFSEMAYLGIVTDKLYITVKKVLNGENGIESLAEFINQSDSIEPPIDCFVF